MPPQSRSRLLILVIVVLLLLGFAAAKLAMLSSIELQTALQENAQLRARPVNTGSLADGQIHDAGSGRTVVLLPSDKTITEAWVINTTTKTSRPASASANGVWSPSVSSKRVGDAIVIEWIGEGGHSSAYEIVDAKTDALRFALRLSEGQDLFLERGAQSMTVRVDADCKTVDEGGGPTAMSTGLVVNETKRLSFAKNQEVGCAPGVEEDEFFSHLFSSPEIDPQGLVRFALPGGGTIEIDMDRLTPEGIKILES